MSYKIKSLTVKNFVVFVDETSIEFSKSSLNQIEAVFKNDPNQSNGAGKSILICAISLALFGKGIRFNHLADYIAPTNPNGGIYISLVLEDASGNILKVERWRRENTETNKARVWMNGVPVSKDATTSKVDELVSGYIGVSHSNFLSCVFSVMLPGFLNLRPAQRFEILENALAVRKMDSLIKKLNTQLRASEERLVATNSVLTEKHHLLGQETARRDIYSQNVETLQNSIERQKVELESLYSQDETLRSRRDEFAELASQVEAKMAERNKEKYSLEVKRRSLQDSMDRISATMRSLDKNLKSIGDAEYECLVCHSTLDKTSEGSIRSHYQSELDLLSANVVKLDEAINLYDTAIAKLEKSYLTAKRSVSKLDSDLNINSSSAMACEKAIATSKQSLQIAMSSFDSTSLDLLTSEVAKLSEQRHGLTKDVKIINAWKQAMSKNGLRLAYLREEVGTLSAIASKFATSVYAKPTKVEFFINEDKDNPQLDFTVNGKGAGAFSTGERRLLEIAITLSLMTLLKTAGMNLEFLILDEALDGLSNTSKTNVLKIVSDLSSDYQVLMISHDNLIKSHAGHVIRVIKDPSVGTSTVETYTR